MRIIGLAGIDAAGWVPKHRERTYIVGFRKPEVAAGQDWRIRSFEDEWDSKNPSEKEFYLKDILESDVPEKYTLGTGTWDTLKCHKAHHESQGHGFSYTLNKYPYKTIARIMSARYHKDGAEILIEQQGKRPRRLTPLECSRLMGFPEDYQKFFNRNNSVPQPVSATQAYRQFGNSVAVPLVTEIVQVMIDKMFEGGAMIRK